MVLFISIFLRGRSRARSNRCLRSRALIWARHSVFCTAAMTQRRIWVGESRPCRSLVIGQHMKERTRKGLDLHPYYPLVASAWRPYLFVLAGK